jgi:hypothetical protein
LRKLLDSPITTKKLLSVDMVVEVRAVGGRSKLVLVDNKMSEI